MAMDILGLKKHTIAWFQAELPNNLYYHGLHHTLDVLQAAEMYAKMEQISEEGMLLVQAGALLHDAGFTKTYFKNEPVGAELAGEVLPKFGFSERQIAIVQRMIMATALPQSPQSQLDQILCDADLDYLGRDDFYAVAHTLKREWADYGLIKNLREWYEQQVRFFEMHRFHTASAQNLRNDQKKRYIAEMYELLGITSPVA